MAYAEIYVGISNDRHGEFRVEIMAPQDIEIPDGFTYDRMGEDEGCKIYASDWFNSIEKVKEKIGEIADFFQARKIKILVYFEMRLI
ncbi:MAG: hypothetical protein Q6356_002550 [Candidatus Wukongarchaeota archaeon]|nr:hypothetical protein [Candidatus Wukongarchaeota archaeon]MDO8095629.1 hypothetical protein [Candidatus Wukongarchaeota archaeon]